ncbi:MAG: hypothetical protein ACYC0O_00870 [Desulfurivibrionaceae bacterium]|jgi:hypothetical protein|nr:hypothetical protein [Pseudomonadota bacterium]MCG2823943.1 hypothetical protein [Desulfobulbaceae bacterium]MDP2002337.1 hypothetical protein [Desulfurivibrionaceae bacterium]MDP2756896.1 hypothetical protein [Desulfurivibrionaceae bacterium]PKN16752.1 MAG: hypothetical protein CVU68_11280 [Deltaproteobacteria bacterium HGW-Deltaproteobacteria-3]
MIANKKEFGGGLVMMVGFWIVFALLLSPLYPGEGKKVNMLDYMDNMYNSISKKSSYYIPAAREKAEAYKGEMITLNIKTGESLSAQRLTTILQHAGATVQAGEQEITVSGDLGGILTAVLADADAMFANDGQAVSAKYGANEKQVMFDWYNALKSMEKSLTKQEKFKESKMLYQVRTKTVEPAYNYYGIEAQSIKDKAVLVIFSLAGYVIYTMWFGFAILFMFEGWGLKLEH